MTTRVIDGKVVTVNLTIRNNLPSNITDGQVSDAALPSGMRGKPVSARHNGPIASGSSWAVSYDVAADTAGSYTLGQATITFADSTGNYQKISSDGMTITVI